MDPNLLIERLDRVVQLLERITVAVQTSANRTASDPQGGSIPGEEGLWDAKQVAAYLHCSESKIYKAAEAGTFPCVRDGRSLRFEPAAVRAHIRSRSKTGTILRLHS